MSDVVFKCPYCEQEIAAPDSMAGAMINCPGCEGLFRIPGSATVQGWLAGRHFPTPALRPKFLILVEALELTQHLHAALWLDDLPPTRNSG